MIPKLAQEDYQNKNKQLDPTKRVSDKTITGEWFNQLLPTKS